MPLISETDTEYFQKFIPSTVKRRRTVIFSIVDGLKRFKSLNEENRDDFQEVLSIVQKMFPDTALRTQKDYARTAIRVWNIQRVDS